MSSGQWEVVGKSKKSQNGKVKSKEDEKKVIKNGPKLEDICKFYLSTQKYVITFVFTLFCWNNSTLLIL